MCQQWLLVFGHLLELAGFLFVAFELRKMFARKRPQEHVFMFGVAFVVVGMLSQTAGGWVGRIPLDFFKSCY
jgi:hypothetical protein